MNEKLESLFDKEQTSAAIHNLVYEFHTDLDLVLSDDKPVSNMELNDFFLLVKNIPYRKDIKPIEIICRPYYIFKHAGLGMDCKKKCIVLASWCECNDFNYRLIGSSSRSDKRVHHIFPQIFINGKWKNIDATYSHYKLFEPKTNITYSEVL